MAESSDLDWTMQGINNPQLLQEKILNRLQDTTGTVVVDPNNPACVLMEAFASEAAGLVRTVEDQIRPAIYPARANSASDLFKHLSDYEYVDVFASPATTTVQMIVDKVYCFEHGVPLPLESQPNFRDKDGNVRTTERKLVIPATTKFTIGEHVFGIYYPIVIRTNSVTGKFTVNYDTSVKNPMKTLATNALNYDTRYFDGHELAYIEIPVYQFDVSTTKDILVNGSGYKKSIPYSNHFYAIRCRASVLQNPGHDATESDVWAEKELSLCVSGQTYDPDDPTVVFTPDTENNTCAIEIPYVYFTNGLIRGTLTIDIYTTEGEISYNVPTGTSEICNVDMFSGLTDQSSQELAEPFRQMPALSVLPCSTTIIGGTNGMSFETLRSRVVTGTLSEKTLQTPDDIEAYFKNLGYVSTILKDGVTDRIFLAHATVKNTDGDVIGSGSIGTLFDLRGSTLANHDTIVASGSNTFTVLPSTVYKFDTVKGVCKPLTIAERNWLKNLTNYEKVDEYNNSVYTRSPYHLQLDVSSRYPTTITYDMNNPEIVSQEFIAARDEVSCQLTMNGITFTTVENDKDDTRNKYQFAISVARTGLSGTVAVVTDSEGIVGLKNFRVIIGFRDDDGVYRYGEATWKNRTDDFDTFVFDLPSNYKFHQANGDHTVMMTVGKNPETDFFLTSEVRIMLCAKKEIIGDLGGNTNRYLVTPFSTTDPSLLDSCANYYALSEYKLMCKYGAMINEVDQRMNLSTSEQTYLKHYTTKFVTTERPIYATDEQGHVIVDIVDVVDPVTHVTKKKAVVKELYPEGTPVCMTKTVEMQEVTINDGNRANYLPVYNDGTTIIGFNYLDTDGVTWKLFNAETPNGTYVFQKAPVVPKFAISKAPDNLIGDSLAIGNYELMDARDVEKTTEGLSNPTNVWSQIGDVPRKLVVKDVLFMLMSELFGTYESNPDGTFKSWTPNAQYVSDGEGATYPLLGVTAKVGTFRLVYNVGNDPALFDNTVPTIGDVSKTASTLLKIYYCASSSDTVSTWAEVAYAADDKNALAAFVWENIKSTVLPKTFGYMYYLDIPHPEDPDGNQTFAAFLNTRVTGGYTVPDLKMFNVHNYTDGVVTKADRYAGWRATVDKWPWDVTQWYLSGIDETRRYFEPISSLTTVFESKTIFKYCEYRSGQYDLSDDGELQPDPSSSRYLEYLVDMLQIDGKMSQLTGANYPVNITSVLESHFDNLGNARNTMFTNSRIFFEPNKSLGFASFDVGDGKTEDIQLDVSIAFKIYVSKASADNETLMKTMREQIIELIDSDILNYHGLNCTRVAASILSSLGDTILRVDVLGINGDPELQSIKCLDTEAVPHLATKLEVLDDGVTIELGRKLDLTIVSVEE